MLWSTFLYAPDKTLNPKFVLNGFIYAVKCVNKGGLFFPNLSFQPLLDTISFNITAGGKNPQPVNIDTIGTEGKEIKFQYVPEKKKEARKLEINVHFPEPLLFNQVFFTMDPPLDEEVDIYVSYLDELEEVYSKARLVSHTTYGQNTFIDLGEINTSSVKFILKTEDPRDTWTFCNLEFYSFYDDAQPYFAYLMSGIIESDGGIKRIRISSQFTGKPIIFFRYDEERSGINNSKWTVIRSLEGNETDLYTIRGFYQLLVVIEVENPYSSLGALETNW